jgi:hypothetical protein
MDGLEYCDACGAKLPASSPTPAEPVAASAEVDSAPSSVEPAVDQEPVAPVPVSAPAAAPAAALQQAKLTILRGGTVGKVFSLQAGDNLIGRWDPDSGSFPEVDMENDDPEARISRKHALIKLSDTITIEDIGSLNGTFVNRGRRLDPGSPVALKDGDEVIVGKTFFKLSLS